MHHQPQGGGNDADCYYGDGRAGHHLRDAFHCADSTVETALLGGLVSKTLNHSKTLENYATRIVRRSTALATMARLHPRPWQEWLILAIGVISVLALGWVVILLATGRW